MDGRRVWDSKALGDIAEDGETQRTRRGRAYSLKDDRGIWAVPHDARKAAHGVRLKGQEAAVCALYGRTKSQLVNLHWFVTKG